MVQSLNFSLDVLSATTDSNLLVEMNTAVRSDRPVSPTEIQDEVTLSREALAATRSSHVLSFPSANTAAASAQASDNAIFSGQSQIQNLLYEGYSLSQIASEFNLPLAAAEQSALGTGTFTSAA